MLGPTATLVLIVVLAMLSAGALAYTLLFGRISNEKQASERLSRVQTQSRTSAAATTRQAVDPAKRRKSVQETLKELDQKQKARAKETSSPPLVLALQQAGLAWTKRTFIMISIGCGLALALVTLILGLPLYAVTAASLAGALGLPRWIVSFMRKRRFRQFLDEFPNAVDVIVRGIKSGLPVNDCFRIIALEAKEPVRSEFRQIIEAQALGIPTADAVGRLPERVPVPEANFFAIVIAIQQRAGGNLSEALGNLSRVLRERKKMKGKIKAMSMEAKASAYIIGSLPIIVMGMVYLTSPKYIALLFIDSVGNVVLGAAALWMLIGILVMKKMVNFDY